MRRSGSIVGRQSGKLKAPDVDMNSPSSMLLSRFRSGLGSLKGIGNNRQKEKNEPDGLKRAFGSSKNLGLGRGKGKMDVENDALMRRVKKDNARLLRELEELEARVKEGNEIAEENERLRGEIADMKKKVVNKVEVEKVVKALKEEKVALAMLQMEKDALDMRIMNYKRSGGRRSARSTK